MQLPLRPPTLSIVVPVHNETGSIEPFLARTIPVLKGLAKGFDYEIVFVDDGSTDATLAELLAARKADPRIKVVALSRNFGKDTALAAGLAHATGKGVIPMDVDLQDPPEVIPQMYARWREGFDVVNGGGLAESWRIQRDTPGYIPRFTADELRGKLAEAKRYRDM